MHGMIFSEVRNYVEQRHRPGSWDTLLAKAVLKGRVYLASGGYPDAEVMTLVSAVAAMTSQTAPVLLEAFGKFLVPVLMKLHGHMLRPTSKTPDVIEHTECTMHRIVRIENHASSSPKG
jgi:hypothetical protein